MNKHRITLENFKDGDVVTTECVTDTDYSAGVDFAAIFETAVCDSPATRATSRCPWPAASATRIAWSRRVTHSAALAALTPTDRSSALTDRAERRGVGDVETLASADRVPDVERQIVCTLAGQPFGHNLRAGLAGAFDVDACRAAHVKQSGNKVATLQPREWK